MIPIEWQRLSGDSLNAYGGRISHHKIELDCASRLPFAIHQSTKINSTIIESLLVQMLMIQRNCGRSYVLHYILVLTLYSLLMTLINVG